uniref:sterol 26-hydroxylase, mitochondrial isoform X2 n=1 Tax=Epinephelus lanceolatus TaxID=310571 RepID=UPI001445A9E5|nr:sterol 26-hydroxylase, mitochondrial isoform X2 [Epinephelus lanceolatus]
MAARCFTSLAVCLPTCLRYWCCVVGRLSVCCSGPPVCAAAFVGCGRWWRCWCLVVVSILPSCPLCSWEWVASLSVCHVCLIGELGDKAAAIPGRSSDSFGRLSVCCSGPPVCAAAFVGCVAGGRWWRCWCLVVVSILPSCPLCSWEWVASLSVCHVCLSALTMAAWLSQSVKRRNNSWLLLCPNAVARVCSRGEGSSSSVPREPSAFQEKPRTVKDLPRITFLELLYSVAFKGFSNHFHELQIYNKQRYGPMFRDPTNAICVNTPKLLEEVLRNDEKFPSRGDMSIWKEYRDMKGIGYGPFTEEGEKWYNLRVMLNKRMLLPKESAQYGGVFNDVVTDFIKRIYYLRQGSLTGDLVTNVGNEMYHFALEGIASILFEQRLGCLEKEIPAGTQDFINSIVQMFSNNMAVHLLPKWSRNLLPFWGRYIAGWEGIFSFAKQLIDKKMEVIHQHLENHQDMEGKYLTYLLSNTQLSTKDVYGSITELLLAGVDTTSNTLTWTMYLLSKNPQSQDKLYKEVSTSVPADRIPSAEEVTQMPYLKAIIKETLRMYPVVPLNARIIMEKDVTIGGYHFPKKTSFSFCNYAISYDEDTFSEPFTFKPERWLRDGHKRPNPFGSLPFGFGVRACVGRRIAEVEMYLILFRIIRCFEIKPDPTMGELKSINRTVLVPDKPLNLHFVDRGCKNAA